MMKHTKTEADILLENGATIATDEELSQGTSTTKSITPQNTKEDWEKDLDAILDGIDKDECEYEHGWWETSTGAEFGAKKKVELKALISKLLGLADLKERINKEI